MLQAFRILFLPQDWLETVYGSANVNSAAAQMAQIVEESVKSTVTVMDKVNAATEEVHRNNELAGQLEQGFDNVKDAVNKGNAAVEEAKSTIMSVENTVGAAHKTTGALLTEMKQWKQHDYALSHGLESSLNIVVVSELLHMQWIDYIAILEAEFPSLQINIFSAPQEDAQKMLLNGTAQLALMFEREQLESSEQFVELKLETLVPVANKDFILAQFPQVSFEQIQHSRQIVVASRDKSIKPELLYSKQYWRTDNHHSACALIMQNFGWGVLPLEMLNENPQLKKQLKILDLLDFTPKFEYFVDLVWSRESELGAAARFLIQYIRNQRKKV